MSKCIYTVKVRMQILDKYLNFVVFFLHLFQRVHVISFGFVFVNTILIAVVLGVLMHHQRAMR